MSPSMGLIAELQRRSVFKVGAAYLVVGWLLVQGASIAFPAFDAPTGFLRGFILLVLLGFPLALVLAWAFELTPEGVKVDTTGVGSRRMLLFAAVLAIAALGWFFAGRPGFDPGEPDARSIAVLPFVNMSGDEDNEYFSEGVSEEILNALAQVPELRVAARTSSFSFKGGSKAIAQIADELQVRLVLEGSVRKQGDRVRITAQLIDAKEGFHLWSESYDRDLKDIFAIQHEIAHAVAGKLAAELTDAHGEARGGTRDPAAHDLYLKGLALWQARGEVNLRAAAEAFQAAAEMDPGFAKAWAGVALAHAILPDWSTDAPAAHLRAARDAAERALGLEPDQPEAYATLSLIAATELRFDTANVLMDRALAIAPSYATAHQWYAESLPAQGRTEDALRMAARAVTLDPVSPIMHNIYGLTLHYAGRNDDARRWLQRVPQDAPARYWTDQYLLSIAFQERDATAARELLLALAPRHDTQALAFIDALVGALSGDGDVTAVARRLRELPLPAPGQDPALRLQHIPRFAWQMAVGRNADALDTFAEYATRYPQYARSFARHAPMDPVRCEPRFRAMMAGFGIQDVRLPKTCPGTR